jgi:hypothetical protein
MKEAAANHRLHQLSTDHLFKVRCDVLIAVNVKNTVFWDDILQSGSHLPNVKTEFFIYSKILEIFVLSLTSIFD